MPEGDMSYGKKEPKSKERETGRTGVGLQFKRGDSGRSWYQGNT